MQACYHHVNSLTHQGFPLSLPDNAYEYQRFARVFCYLGISGGSQASVSSFIFLFLFQFQISYDEDKVAEAKEHLGSATPDERLLLMAATFPHRLAMMADGATVQKIVETYPDITKTYVVRK